MPTNVSLQNNLAATLTAPTVVTPSLSTKYWGVASQVAPDGQQTRLLWMDRDEGITNHRSWVFTTTVTVGGVVVLLQEQLTGTLTSSDLEVQIVAGSLATGWESSDTALTFLGTDGNTYRVTATFALVGTFDDVTFAATLVATDAILPQIRHVVVLMNENRSLDNLLGWVYAGGPTPTQFLPTDSAKTFDGLSAKTYSNTDPAVNGGQPVYASEGTTAWTEGGTTVSEWFVPSPDPGEEFAHVTTQVFDGGATATMGGFLTDYVGQVTAVPAPAASAAQIMQSFSPTQLPVINTLAQSFAVSDAWYCSVPSQTWPNRGFVQTGSSDGTTDNDSYLPWDITTVFDVLGSQHLSWIVYNDGTLQSLTKTMFLTKYLGNETNFSGISEFQTAAAQPADAPANLKLPTFSFVEPNFGVIGNDESYHPPHDVRPGEQFLATIYNTLAASPYRDDILFVVLFDEHGGTYDHVVPPSGAQPPAPDPIATDGTGFGFDRFGVRVPAIVVSSWVQPGTVFRTNTAVPLDHTSVLATLRDWLGLADDYATMLPSPRIVAAPNLGFVLTETSPQAWPTITAPSLGKTVIPEPGDDEPLNDVQRRLLVGAAGRAAGRAFTEDESARARAALRTHGDGRTWMAALTAHLPLK